MMQPAVTIMPYQLHWLSRGIVIAYSGELALNDVLMSHQEIAADDRFDGLRFALVDTQAVDASSLSVADARTIDAFLKGPYITNPMIYVVIIADSAEVLKAISMLPRASGGAYGVHVCPTLEKAKRKIANAVPGALFGSGRHWK